MEGLSLIIDKISMSPLTWREYIFIAVIGVLALQYWLLVQQKEGSKLFINILRDKSELTDSTLKPEVVLSENLLKRISNSKMEEEKVKLIFNFLNGVVGFNEFEKETRKSYYYGFLYPNRLKRIEALIQEVTIEYHKVKNENKFKELPLAREKMYRKIKIDEGDITFDSFTGNTRFKYTFLFVEMISIDKRKSKNYLLFKKGIKSEKDLEELSRIEKNRITKEYYEINRAFFNKTVKTIQNQNFQTLDEFYKWDQFVNDLKRDLTLAILFVGHRIESGKYTEYFDIELMNHIFDELDKL